MERPVWKWIGRIPTMMVLSLFWYVCCIPVVTILPACCALFDAVSRGLLLDDEKGALKRFFRSFVHKLKRGIPLTLLWLTIIVIALGGYWIAAENFGLYFIIYMIVLLTLVAYLSWLIALEARYHNSFWQLHKNALYFYLGRLPGSGLMLLSTVGVVLLSLRTPAAYILLTVAPALIAILHTFPVEKAFRAVFPQDYVDEVPEDDPA